MKIFIRLLLFTLGLVLLVCATLFPAARRADSDVHWVAIQEWVGSDLVHYVSTTHSKTTVHIPYWQNLFGWSQDGKWVIVDAELDGEPGVFRLQLETGEFTRMSKPYDDGRFAFDQGWSPNGEYALTYAIEPTDSRRYNIFRWADAVVVDVGDYQTLLWGENDQSLVYLDGFYHESSVTRELFYLGSNANEPVQLTFHNNDICALVDNFGRILAPQFSPDEDWVVYISCAYWRDTPYQLWKVRTDGSNPTLLFESPADRTINLLGVSEDAATVLKFGTNAEPHEIYRVPLDGSEPTWVVREDLVLNPQEGMVFTSRDGEWLAYMRRTDDTRDTGLVELYVARTDGSEPNLVSDYHFSSPLIYRRYLRDFIGDYFVYTESASEDIVDFKSYHLLTGEDVLLATGVTQTIDTRWAHFSPDERRIWFSQADHLISKTLDGENVVEFEKAVVRESILPDNQHLLVRFEPAEFVLVDMNTGTSQPLLAFDNAEVNVVWSADGGLMAFLVPQDLAATVLRVADGKQWHFDIPEYIDPSSLSWNLERRQFGLNDQGYNQNFVLDQITEKVQAVQGDQVRVFTSPAPMPEAPFPKSVGVVGLVCVGLGLVIHRRKI